MGCIPGYQKSISIGFKRKGYRKDSRDTLNKLCPLKFFVALYRSIKKLYPILFPILLPRTPMPNAVSLWKYPYIAPVALSDIEIGKIFIIVYVNHQIFSA